MINDVLPSKNDTLPSQIENAEKINLPIRTPVSQLNLLSFSCSVSTPVLLVAKAFPS